MKQLNSLKSHKITLAAEKKVYVGKD